jgi:methionyl aminopeptidase
MSITTENDRVGIQRASNAVAITLKKMREFAKPGISTKQLDDYGGELLAQMGARSAPALTYGFPRVYMY